MGQLGQLEGCIMLKIGIVLTTTTCFAAFLIAYPFSPKAAAVSAQAVAMSAQTQVLRVAQSAVETAAVTIARADELPVTAPRTERQEDNRHVRVADTTTNS